MMLDLRFTDLAHLSFLNSQIWKHLRARAPDPQLSDLVIEWAKQDNDCISSTFTEASSVGTPSHEGICREIRKMRVKLLVWCLRAGITIAEGLPNEVFQIIRRRVSSISLEEANVLREVICGKRDTAMYKPFRLCHISDLHLGLFHWKKPKVLHSGITYEILDGLTEFVRSKQPDLILFTGDISSMGEQGLLDHFSKHLQQYSTDAQHQVDLNRIVVLPGNHDVFWPKNREGNIIRFRNVFQDYVWNTPFSCARDNCFPFEDQNMRGAIFGYPEYGLLVIALNSCALSGAIDEKIRDLRQRVNAENLQQAPKEEICRLIDELLHVDVSYLPGRYVQSAMATAAKALERYGGNRSEWFVCVLMHHNLTGEFPGAEVVIPAHAYHIRELLSPCLDLPQNYIQGVDCVLHGHVHVPSSFQKAIQRPHIIGAATLGGVDRPEALGLNLIEVQPAFRGECRRRSVSRYEWRKGRFGPDPVETMSLSPGPA